ncbi:YchJ family protein [Porticoccaceae bacterium LTM1]|nr:YchJ family protein [Porticoccaceae bacterium LTM1]
MKNCLMTICPCGSAKPYANCCQPYHNGTPAPTAETLMRSRYSAFCKGLVDYLVETHHPDKRQVDDREVLAQTIASTHWLNLQVISSDSDQVEFIATYEDQGELGQLHERSRFTKEDDRWFYLDGEILPAQVNAGRNDPCPCGSGKKFKKCHGN